MAKVTIDGKEYDSDNLSDNAKAQLNSLNYIKTELQKLENHAAILRTAQAAYSNALKSELPN
tara:strand:+ start:504 stop:689 length:186 start_codon:yes stop_codon:yes gene_type:complete